MATSWPVTGLRGRLSRRRACVLLVGGLPLLAVSCGNSLPLGAIKDAAAGGHFVEVRTVGGEGTRSGPGNRGTSASSEQGVSASTARAATASGAKATNGPTTAASGASNTQTNAPQSAAAGAANGSTIVLGNIGSYSGVLGSIFVGGAAPLQAWAQYTNAHGGLNGHPVKVVSADDGGNPSQALSLAEQMVQSDGVVAFVGNMMPLTLQGIQPYLEQNNIPLIGGDETLPAWIQSSVIFPVGTDVQSIGSAGLHLITQGGITKLAILYCGESPSCKTLASSPPPAGVSVVYEAQISIVQTDFTTECLQAKSQGAQAIFVAADANTVERVATSCGQQNYNPKYGTASIAVGPQLASDPSMNGLVAPVNNAPWFSTNTPATAAFAQAMATYEPSAPLSATGMTMWASGQVLIAATAGKLSAHPTSAEIISDLDQVSNLTTGGLTPSLTYHAGQGAGTIPCYFEVEVQNGNWVAPNGNNPVCS